MTRKLNSQCSLVSYGFSFIAVGGAYIVLKLLLPERTFIHGFLFRAWPIQFFSSWLFAIGIAYWSNRFLIVKGEESVFEKVKLPERSITREDVVTLIRQMPEEHKNRLTFRRFREILQALLYGEDIIRLNEELSRRDMAEVEQRHLVLNHLQSLIPVVGFLGTVIGLSLGMVRFPDVADVVTLRSALKDFAVSLSVAFDTTLLALCYTIVLILLTSFLRHREEALVSKVDEGARILIGRIKVGVEQYPTQIDEGIERLGETLNDALARWREELLLAVQSLFEKLSSQNGEFSSRIEEASELIAKKLEELKKGIQNPPRYQVIVQPLEEQRNE